MNTTILLCSGLVSLLVFAFWAYKTEQIISNQKEQIHLLYQLIRIQTPKQATTSADEVQDNDAKLQELIEKLEWQDLRDANK